MLSGVFVANSSIRWTAALVSRARHCADSLAGPEDGEPGGLKFEGRRIQ